MTTSFDAETLKEVARLWQVRLKKLRHDIPVQGSPERSVFRVVLEDEIGRYFLLEQIPANSLERKKAIAAALDILSRNNLSRIQPYLANKQGEFIINHQNDFWQIAPFAEGIALNRETYIYEQWRGKALANFLVELQGKAKNLLAAKADDAFSLKHYIYKLIREINLYNKNISAEINSVADFLEKDFMRAYEQLPVAFCHGDYHPLNVIWSDEDIKRVIDWEFSGYKSELYDAALLIGCVGVEDPRSLTADLVVSFIAEMKKSGIISKESWKYLTEFIIALRFAWLAEWLRRNDTEMISLEMDYLRLLIDNKTALEKSWP
ncbi:MAG TPA: phosphotransferase [Smithellaceae bacterium]|nr:phosphotransferase [Smithellaceae bacterium]